MVGLPFSLAVRVTDLRSNDPKGDVARAEDWAERAVVAEPDNSVAHLAKAYVLGFGKRQWAQAIAEADAAIAADPNNAEAHAQRGFWKMFLGQSEDGFSGLETAFRLSPRDPDVPIWQYNMCGLHAHLAQWEQAIEWCEKAHAGAPEFWYPLAELAAANAWAGHANDVEAFAHPFLQRLVDLLVDDAADEACAGVCWNEPTRHDPTCDAADAIRTDAAPLPGSRPRRPDPVDLDQAGRLHRLCRWRQQGAQARIPGC
jgi:tetratricopeptide (TPR) repeat protein